MQAKRRAEYTIANVGAESIRPIHTSDLRYGKQWGQPPITLRSIATAVHLELNQVMNTGTTMTKRHHTKLVHEGRYVAEVEIELIDMEEGWAPYLSLDDVASLTRRTVVRQRFAYTTN